MCMQYFWACAYYLAITMKLHLLYEYARRAEHMSTQCPLSCLLNYCTLQIPLVYVYIWTGDSTQVGGNRQNFPIKLPFLASIWTSPACELCRNKLPVIYLLC